MVVERCLAIAPCIVTHTHEKAPTAAGKVARAEDCKFKMAWRFLLFRQHTQCPSAILALRYALSCAVHVQQTHLISQTYLPSTGRGRYFHLPPTRRQFALPAVVRLLISVPAPHLATSRHCKNGEESMPVTALLRRLQRNAVSTGGVVLKVMFYRF